MTYCVVQVEGQWRVALLHGTLKQPEPGVYRSVRAAIAASVHRNAALEATQRPQTADEA